MSKTLDSSMKELMLFAKGEENKVISEEINIKQVNVEVVKSDEVLYLIRNINKSKSNGLNKIEF